MQCRQNPALHISQLGGATGNTFSIRLNLETPNIKALKIKHSYHRDLRLPTNRHGMKIRIVLAILLRTFCPKRWGYSYNYGVQQRCATKQIENVQLATIAPISGESFCVVRYISGSGFEADTSMSTSIPYGTLRRDTPCQIRHIGFLIQQKMVHSPSFRRIFLSTFIVKMEQKKRHFRNFHA